MRTDASQRRGLSPLAIGTIITLLVTVTLWIIVGTTHAKPWTIGWAIGNTVLSPLMLLRLMRGSQVEAEDRLAKRIRDYQENELASRLACKLAFRGEAIAWETRQHPIVLLGVGLRLLTGVVVTIALGLLLIHTPFFRPAALALWVLVGVWTSYRLWAWHRFILIVTPHRIAVRKGVFGRSMNMIPHDKITDGLVSTPWHSRLLTRLRITGQPYGTLIVTVADGKQKFFLPAGQFTYKMVIAPLVAAKAEAQKSGDQGD